jgi:hypothetical protein
MDLSIRDLIMDNYANNLEPGDEEMLNMFGSIKFGEIISSLIGNRSLQKFLICK